MKIGKIILIVLGVALIALGVKGLMDIPGQQAALDAAVYLDEPVVLPENEGKLVIIHGVPEMTAPAYDEELGLTINTIKAYRYAEEYKLISSEKLLYKYNWVSRGSKGIVGEASLGGFALDEKTLSGLLLTVNITTSIWRKSAPTATSWAVEKRRKAPGRTAGG